MDKVKEDRLSMTRSCPPRISFFKKIIIFPAVILGFMFLISGCATSEKLTAYSVPECLPPEIKPDLLAASTEERSAIEVRSTTVADQLRLLKATCHEGKLVDGNGKEIRFFTMRDCSPIDEGREERRAQHERALKLLSELKAHYTVIETACPFDNE